MDLGAICGPSRVEIYSSQSQIIVFYLGWQILKAWSAVLT